MGVSLFRGLWFIRFDSSLAL